MNSRKNKKTDIEKERAQLLEKMSLNIDNETIELLKLARELNQNTYQFYPAIVSSDSGTIDTYQE